VLRTVLFSRGGGGGGGPPPPPPPPGPPDPPREPPDAPRRPDRTRALACVSSKLLLFPLGPPAACLAVLALQDLRVPGYGRTELSRLYLGAGAGCPSR